MDLPDCPPGTEGYEDSVVEVPKKPLNEDKPCTKAEQEFQEHLNNLKIKVEDGSTRFMIERRGRDVSGKWIYLCWPCAAVCSGETILQTHISGKKHKVKLATKKIWPLNIFEDHPYVQSEKGTTNKENAKNTETVLKKMAEEVNTFNKELSEVDHIYNQFRNVKCYIQDSIDNVKAPILGLEYLVEHPPEEEHHEPSYICTLCNKQGHPRTIINHLTCHWHRFNYLARHFPKASQLLHPFRSTQQYREGTNIILSRICQRIVDKYGKLQPAQIEKARYEREKDTIHRWLFQSPHFSEKPGATFEEVVDVDLMESLSQNNPKGKTVAKSKDPSPPVVEAPSKPLFNKFTRPTHRRERCPSLDSLSDVSDEVEPRTRASDHHHRAIKDGDRRAPSPQDSSYNRTHSEHGVVTFRSRYSIRNVPVSTTNTITTGAADKYRVRNPEHKLKLAESKRAAAEAAAQKTLAYHQKNPEKHPLYPEEWKKFWNRRYKEIQSEGKDPSKHDFKPEWIVFWTKRMKELHDEELRIELSEMYRKLNLSPPEDKESSAELKPKENQSKRRSPEPRSRSPYGSRYRSPEPRRRFSDLKRRSPELRRRSPEPRRRSPDSRRRSPEPRRRSPEPRRRSPEPRRRSPEPRRRSPDLRDKSPKFRRSPEPRSRSPYGSRYRSPEPRRRFSDLKRRSPELRRRSPEPRRRSPDSRRRSPEPRRRSPEPRRRSPEPRRRSPEPRRRSPEPRRRSPDLRDKSPKFRSRSPLHRSPNRSSLSSRPVRPGSRSPFSKSRLPDLEVRRSRSPLSRRDPPARNLSPAPSAAASVHAPDSALQTVLISDDELKPDEDLSPWNSEDSLGSLPEVSHFSPRRRSQSRATSIASRSSRSHPYRKTSAHPYPYHYGPAHHTAQDLGSPENVVATLRMLVALEDYLGSIGPKIVDLLTEALKMEKEKANSSEELLERESAVALMETAKEKLKGAVQAGLVSGSAANALRAAVVRAAATLHAADARLSRRRTASDTKQVSERKEKSSVDVSGVGTVDREQIAQQMAAVLVAEGKTDVSAEELAQLVDAVVGMAEAKKREEDARRKVLARAHSIADTKPVAASQPTSPTEAARGAKPTPAATSALQLLQSAYDEQEKRGEKEENVDAMDGLSDSDLETLLKNFSELSAEEQHSLIAYLKKLEAREPTRVERLRQYVNAGEATPSALATVGKQDSQAVTQDSSPPPPPPPATVTIESDDDDYTVDEVLKSVRQKVKEDQIRQEMEIVAQSLKETQSDQKPLCDSSMLLAPASEAGVKTSAAADVFALVQASMQSASGTPRIIDTIASSNSRLRSFGDMPPSNPSHAHTNTTNDFLQPLIHKESNQPFTSQNDTQNLSTQLNPSSNHNNSTPWDRTTKTNIAEGRSGLLVGVGRPVHCPIDEPIDSTGYRDRPVGINEPTSRTGGYGNGPSGTIDNFRGSVVGPRDYNDGSGEYQHNPAGQVIGPGGYRDLPVGQVGEPSSYRNRFDDNLGGPESYKDGPAGQPGDPGLYRDGLGGQMSGSDFYRNRPDGQTGGPGAYRDGPGVIGVNSSYRDAPNEHVYKHGSGGFRDGPVGGTGGFRDGSVGGPGGFRDGPVGGSGEFRDGPVGGSGGFRDRPVGGSRGFRDGPVGGPGGFRDGPVGGSGGFRDGPVGGSGGFRDGPVGGSGGFRDGSVGGLGRFSDGPVYNDLPAGGFGGSRGGSTVNNYQDNTYNQRPSGDLNRMQDNFQNHMNQNTFRRGGDRGAYRGNRGRGRGFY